MTDFHYSIKAKWRVQPTSPTEIGESFLRTLALIAASWPEIGNWRIMPHPFDSGYLTIDGARKNLKEWVEKNVSAIDDRPDPDDGYLLIARTTEESSPESVMLTARLGGRLGDKIRFEVGSFATHSDVATVTYPLFRTAMLAILDLWPPVWAIADLYWPDYDKVPLAGIPALPSSNYRVPWMGYLSSPLIDGLTPPPGVLTERTADGGVLMIAAEERLDPMKLEHRQHAEAIMNVMIARAGALPLNGYDKGGKPWPKPKKPGG